MSDIIESILLSISEFVELDIKKNEKIKRVRFFISCVN